MSEAIEMRLTMTPWREHPNYCRNAVSLRPLGSLTVVGLCGPHHLISPPHLYVCTTLSILNIKHTYLYFVSPSVSFWVYLWVIVCNFGGNGYSFISSCSLEKNWCEIETSTLFVHKVLPKLGRLICGVHSVGTLSERLSGPCRPDQWCVKWWPDSCIRGVLVLQFHMSALVWVCSYPECQDFCCKTRKVLEGFTVRVNKQHLNSNTIKHYLLFL